MTDADRPTESVGPRKGGSLTELVAAPVEAPTGERFSPATWVKIAVFAGLLGAVHHWQLPLLVGIWRRDLNWSHGFLIPLFSLYLLYARREELRAAPRRICLWGLPILIFGLIWQILAYYPVRNNWLTFLSMTVILFGLVLYLAGPQVIRLTWVPIFFLAFAMPLPKRLYTQIALPLQEFAALASTILLRIFGTEIEVTKSHLTIAGRSGAPYELTVAEACSGVRSLMAFVAIGVAIAYLENRPTWQRVILVIMTIPIAILINVIRVSITGTMYVIDRPELGQKFMHEFLGMVMLIPAFLLLWALGWLLQHLLIEEEEQPLETQPPVEGAKT